VAPPERFEQNVPIEDDSLPPVLDVEATPTSQTCHRHLERESAIADMKVMLEEMERHYGRRPVIYTSVDFFEAILSDGAFSDYPIWVRSTKHHPSVRYGSRKWHFWQFQADGYTPGIVGHLRQSCPAQNVNHVLPGELHRNHLAWEIGLTADTREELTQSQRLAEQFADPGDDLAAVQLDVGHELVVRHAGHAVLQVEPGGVQGAEVRGDLLRDGFR